VVAAEMEWGSCSCSCSFESAKGGGSGSGLRKRGSFSGGLGSDGFAVDMIAGSALDRDGVATGTGIGTGT
jgi:hypothetical protein